MSKYIGETEKHLREVFEACERAPVLLLFDEADALFGKRTQVSDAHDRYANIEIDYVLQRMEQFDGVAVLATNRKGDLDTAFVRRLRFIIDFAPPTEGERERLWRIALEGASDVSGQPLIGPLDWQRLGHDLDLTGAGIKSAALAAAFLACERGRPDHRAPRARGRAARAGEAGRRRPARPDGVPVSPAAGRAATPRRAAGDVHIDRLVLRVAGLDEDAARALARLVAEGLAPGMLRPAGTAGLDSLRLEVTAAAPTRAGRTCSRDASWTRSDGCWRATGCRAVLTGRRHRERIRAEGRARRVHADVPAHPAAERDRLPVQPRDDDPHLDPAGASQSAREPSTSNPLAVQGMPGERSPSRSRWTPTTTSPTAARRLAALATVSGLYSRLAALEMLLYPTGTSPTRLLGAVSAAIGSALSGTSSGPTAPSRSPSCRSRCSSGARDGSCPSG